MSEFELPVWKPCEEEAMYRVLDLKQSKSNTASRSRRENGKNIKSNGRAFGGHQEPSRDATDAAMFKLKISVPVFFPAAVSATTTGQFCSRSLVEIPADPRSRKSRR